MTSHACILFLHLKLTVFLIQPPPPPPPRIAHFSNYTGRFIQVYKIFFYGKTITAHSLHFYGTHPKHSISFEHQVNRCRFQAVNNSSCQTKLTLIISRKLTKSSLVRCGCTRSAVNEKQKYTNQSRRLINTVASLLGNVTITLNSNVFLVWTHKNLGRINS